MRRLYTFLLFLLLPAVLLRLAWRARRQPGYLRRLGERFGRYDTRPDKPVIWIHAVSVGETRAAQPLLEAIRARHPEACVLLTHMTPTGLETGRALFGDTVLQSWLPYDYPFAVRGFLRHFRPHLGLLMETELWPNLISGCREENMPLWLVNARLSAPAARRYARLGPLVRQTLAGLAGVAAQTEGDAARLQALGARNVHVTGNLKFDVTPPPDAAARAAALRARFPGRPVVLAASTRDGEEALLLDALATCSVPDLLFVIVPRHPQRFDTVAELLAKRRIPFQRRSAGTAGAPQRSGASPSRSSKPASAPRKTKARKDKRRAHQRPPRPSRNPQDERTRALGKLGKPPPHSPFMPSTARSLSPTRERTG